MPDAKTETTTRVGMGYANRADAFQCGREAAQMAKRQLPDGNIDVIFVFAPGDVHFKDYIEGARLVVGEEELIGVPVGRVFSADFNAPDACVVLVLRSPQMRFSIAYGECDQSNVLVATTQVRTQIRSARGSAAQQFDNGGLIVFTNTVRDEASTLAHHFGADAGLEPWMFGCSPTVASPSPLVCRNRTVQEGAVAVECLSNQPWGIGTVGIGSFLNQRDIYREAARAAMRNARNQLQSREPALGLLSFDFPVERFDENDILDIFECAISVCPNIPILGIPAAHQFSRSINRSVTTHTESIVAMLVPL